MGRRQTAVKGCSKALKKDNDLPHKSETYDASNQQKAELQEKAELRNRVAVALLTIALTNELSFQLMEGAIATDVTNWPEGKAVDIMNALENKHAPKTATTRVEQRNALEIVKMTAGEDPENFSSDWQKL